MIKEYIKITLGNLRHRNLRSWLTIIGIIIGIAAVVSFLTLNQSVLKGVEEQFETLGVSDIRITPAELAGPPNENRVLDAEIVKEVEKFSTVEYVDPVAIDVAEVEFSNDIRFLAITGTRITSGEERLADLSVEIESGSFLKPQDKYAATIGINIAEVAFIKKSKSRRHIRNNEPIIYSGGYFSAKRQRCR